jgi:hypothetical protein
MQQSAALGNPPPASQTVAAAADAEILRDLNLDFAGMEKVKVAALSMDMAAIQKAYLEYRRKFSTAKWTKMPDDMPAVATATNDQIGDEILQHHIRNSFYNFSPHQADMGRQFNWTYNPVDRHSQQFSDEWTYCAISRTQFWEQLADAYWKTHNEKYAEEWVVELEDFAVKNPREGQSSNGAPSLWRTLDASIRMSESWPYTYYHMLNSPAFTPHAQWTYLMEMREHASLLEGGLRNQERTGNWVASETFGLYTIATLFPELKESAHWRELALNRIASEMQRMVPPDGFEGELTPNYHMVSLDGFRGPLVLAELNHYKVPANMREKLVSMYRALVMVMEQNGDLVNTNDSSQWNAIETSRKGLELGYDPLLEWAASGGKQGKGLPDSTMLPYAGFYTMRSGWKPDDQFLFFRGGPTGCAHEHEDMLQVVLKSWGKTLLLDPGNAPYDHSDWRRFILGTAAHNTIVVDDKWQHRGSSKVPAERPLNNPWVTTPLFDSVAATYNGGYQKNVFNQQIQYQPMDWVGSIDHSVTHTRRVLYLRPYYALILDTVDGKGRHTIDSHFNVASPSVRVDPKTQAAFSQSSGDVQIALYSLEREHLKVDVIQGEHGAPDIMWAIPTVQFRKEQEAPAVFATFLYPYKGLEPNFRSEPVIVTGEGVWGQRIHTGKEDMEIVLVKGSTPRELSLESILIGKVNVTASGLVVRKASTTNDVLVGGWGLSSYKSKDVQLTVEAPSSLLIGQLEGHPVIMNGGDKPIRIMLQRPFAQTLTLPPATVAEIDPTGPHLRQDTSSFMLPAEIEQGVSQTDQGSNLRATK